MCALANFAQRQLQTEASPVTICKQTGFSCKSFCWGSSEVVAALLAMSAHAFRRTDSYRFVATLTASSTVSIWRLGVATRHRRYRLQQIEGLAMGTTSEIYGVNPSTAQLVKMLGHYRRPQCGSGYTHRPVATAGQCRTDVRQQRLAVPAMNAVVYRIDPATAGPLLRLAAPGLRCPGLAGSRADRYPPVGLVWHGGNGDRGKFTASIPIQARQRCWVR